MKTKRNIWGNLTIVLAVLSMVACNQPEIKLEAFDFPLANRGDKPYPFSSDIEKDVSEFAAQAKAWNYANIGNYKALLKSWDQGRDGETPKLSEKDSLSFRAKYHAEKAIPYIIERSKMEQVIIVNEAHHMPLHRVFTTRLLEGLYENGYRYLGLEGLTVGGDSDYELNSNGYPSLNSGYYTKEPQFGNLLRVAMDMGFELFSYEAAGDENGKEREIAQAQNIVAFMDKHPDEKVLIHCGFAHAAEGEYKSWEKTMAGRLKEYSGIDPLTINQTSYAEKSERRFESPYYKAFHPKESVVFIDDEGKGFQEGNKSYYYDLYVFHPRTRQPERPEWLLFADRKVMEFNLNHEELTPPFMLFVYAENEPIGTAVPLEVMEIQHKEQPITCILPPGKHNLVVQNASGTAFRSEIVVE